VQPLPDDLPDDLPGDLLDELDAFLMQASYDEIDPVTRRISDRQLYTLVASEPFIRRDGRQTVLAIWQSHCAQCGQCFEFKRPTRAVKFQPNRRCQLKASWRSGLVAKETSQVSSSFTARQSGFARCRGAGPERVRGSARRLPRPTLVGLHTGEG